MIISALDFAAFFEEIHGHPPFKWQEELAKQVCNSGTWPQALSLPTAAGKTSVIDIAVFHLALEATKKYDRKAPIRIAFVVDRRLVVDDAFEHASKIAKKIQESKGSVTRKVAKVLKNLSLSDNPLNVVKIRGGIVQENDWVKTPTQPLIIISTVDQVGSRLLFRGYGVSNSMRPVHAGLLGSDVLYILDEAHTSQPFCDTLNKIQTMQSVKKLRPFRFVFMSATLTGKDSSWPDEELAKKLFQDERMQKRLSAHKYAKLEKIKPVKEQQSNKFVKLAFDLAKSDTVKSIGIVVNRVNAARDIFSHIRQKIDENESYENYEIHLLIGRIRPLERDTFVKNKINQIRNDSKIVAKKVFFVATQCIEVGVDISFDALITQIAPIDSLRQRFGRLNRIGEQQESKAIIVANQNEISSTSKDDPIYKDVLPRVWSYLQEHKNENNEIDFGIDHFKDYPKNTDILAPKPNSVTLLPGYINFWTQTRPSPNPDPSPQFFLHGRDAKSPDIQIIWRVDITKSMLESDNNSKSYRQTFVSPPSQLEAISIPIWTVKKWLSEKRDESVSDLEGVSEQEDESGEETDTKVIRWAGKKSQNTQVINSKDIIPGDTIIVPSTYGGCDKYGWDDASKSMVTDIGIESNLVHRRRLTLRLNEHMVTCLCNTNVWNEIKKITVEHAETPNHSELIDDLNQVKGIPNLWKRILNIMKQDVRSIGIEKITEYDTVRISGITYKKRIKLSEIEGIFADEDNDDVYKCAEREDLSSESSTDEEHKSDPDTKIIDLVEHCQGVQKHVNEFGSSVGLDEKILNDLKIAAFLHDAGKAEKRVQALFRKQDPDELYDYQVIAKGTSSINSKEEYEKYLNIAYLPKGYRHECWSVNLAKNHPSMKDANDTELVLYLIGTHHGYGRPLFPIVDDKHTSPNTFFFDGTKAKSDCEIIQIDSGWIEMVNKLGEKYGHWQLAYLESIIRLADHRQSEEEEMT